MHLHRWWTGVGDHINHITKKIASGAYALQAVRRYLCLDNMKSLYHSLVHSHLTYGTLLWGSAFKYRLHKVEILQKKAIRNTCNTVYNAPTAPLFKQLGIAKLIDVYNIQLCKLMYSYTSGTLLTPLKNNIYKQLSCPYLWNSTRCWPSCRC